MLVCARVCSLQLDEAVSDTGACPTSREEGLGSLGTQNKSNNEEAGLVRVLLTAFLDPAGHEKGQAGANRIMASVGCFSAGPRPGETSRNRHQRSGCGRVEEQPDQ